jgi:hypothetical protein
MKNTGKANTDFYFTIRIEEAERHEQTSPVCFDASVKVQRRISDGHDEVHIWCQCPFCGKKRKAKKYGSIYAAGRCIQCDAEWIFAYQKWQEMPDTYLGDASLRYEDILISLCPKCFDIAVDYNPEDNYDYCSSCNKGWKHKEWCSFFKSKPDFMDEKTWSDWKKVQERLAEVGRYPDPENDILEATNQGEDL